MDEDAIAKLIVTQGKKSINLTMFSKEEQNSIMEKVAEHYLRLGKMEEFLAVLEVIDKSKFSDIVRRKAEDLLGMGEYQQAMRLYQKIGEQQMADTIKENFLSN